MSCVASISKLVCDKSGAPDCNIFKIKQNLYFIWVIYNVMVLGYVFIYCVRKHCVFLWLKQYERAYKVHCRSGLHCRCCYRLTHHAQWSVGQRQLILYRCHLLKVPELAGFWLLSILLQFPLILFQLFNEAILIQPLERGVHVVLALLILTQVGIHSF